MTQCSDKIQGSKGQEGKPCSLLYPSLYIIFSTSYQANIDFNGKNSIWGTRGTPLWGD